MPIRVVEDPQEYGPLAIPSGLDLTPEGRDSPGTLGVIGAAFRQENTIASRLTGYSYDPREEIDPDFRVFDEIKGTEFEQYADRFVGAPNRTAMERMQEQIRREEEDAMTVAAAGWGGFAASMGAAILSPSTFLPGGAVVKGARGVNIARTSLSVAAWTGIAAGIDEAFLHQSQQTRTGTESALAIGGSFLLGGVLGAGAGKLSQARFAQAARETEVAIEAIHGYVEQSRSIGAASVLDENFRLNNESVMQSIKSVPVLRMVVQQDPLIRTQLAENQAARWTVANLAESPSVYEINADGRSVTGGLQPVEAIIRDWRNDAEVKAVQSLRDTFSRYWHDGNVGTIGTLTGPITRTYSNLVGRAGKLDFNEFTEEVGRAMFANEAHPIPQVAEAAAKLRDTIFARAERDLVDLGVLPDDLKLENGENYFTRVYNQGLIDAHWGSGDRFDLKPVLVDEFQRKQEIVRERIANDRTVENIEAERFRADEQRRGAQRSLDDARERARGKRDRALAAIKREGAVGRASGALRRIMLARADDLEGRLLTDAERSSLGRALADIRGIKNLRPADILEQIRRLGGIADERTGTRWTGRGWAGDKPTDIEQIMGPRASSIRRKDGMTLDDMRGALEELGFLPEGSTEADLLGAMARAAGGEDVFSRMADTDQLARYEAAQEFEAALRDLGIDPTDKIDNIIRQIPGKARNPATTRAKAKEAGRGANQAAAKEDAAGARLEKAVDRLEEAQERLRYLDDEAAPKIREEIRAAREELARLRPELKKARAERQSDEAFAEMTRDEVAEIADQVRRNIVGLKAGEPHFSAALANSLHARTLDVPTQAIMPWLKTNSIDVTGHYINSAVPWIEMTRRFGDADMTGPMKQIEDEYLQRIDRLAPNSRRRRQLTKERDRTIADVEGMRDRVLGRYGLPQNPESWFVKGGRVARAISYPAFLGNMVISAFPDIANLLRNGMETTMALPDTLVNPRRAFRNLKEASEFGGAAEIYLNSRMHTLGEMFDPHSARSNLENVLAESGRVFSMATGMTPWNAFWKSASGMIGASRLAKAVTADAAGAATKRQLRLLGEANIDSGMSRRIAAQLDAHADKAGALWAPRGAEWTDPDAFAAFRQAMSREVNMQVITPGQDVPLTFSTEGGKFFLQFKRFAWSMHHRFLIAGISRADAEFASQTALLLTLGAMVSRIKAWQGGYDQKEGADLWMDAIDRSGISGWLMEAYNAQAAASIVPLMTGGAFDGRIGDELTSRYQARNKFYGYLGPSVDMAAGLTEGVAGLTSENGGTYRDVRKLMRPIPLNNAAHFQWIMQQVEDGLVAAFGAEPRPD